MPSRTYFTSRLRTPANWRTISWEIANSLPLLFPVKVFALHAPEVWALFAYYSCSIALCILFTISTGVMLRSARCQRLRRVGPALSPWLLLIPSIIWLIYFVVTAHEAIAITSLDTEDDTFAAEVYHSGFDVDLSKAISLAVDNKQPGNVRFYASCRIADLISLAKDSARSNVFEMVANAPAFQTEFFKTNDITCGFFTPNYAEGPYTVREIIEKRLRAIHPDARKNATP